VPESRVMHIGGQSTQVTNSSASPSRLPDCWFASRRRYLAVTLGVRHAMATDLVALLAYSLGWLKRLVLLRMHTARPYLIRDMIRHSVLWPGNRDFPPVRCSTHAVEEASEFRPARLQHALAPPENL
jgi:hypothetical protein